MRHPGLPARECCRPSRRRPAPSCLSTARFGPALPVESVIDCRAMPGTLVVSALSAPSARVARQWGPGAKGSVGVAPGRRAVVAGAVSKPKIIISGAPASGKGTQCEIIVQEWGLPHISAGDLLRAEVAAGTEAGKRAKGFMDNGQLVPDEVVTTMVKGRHAQADCVEKGWLLDGYPRSASQAKSLEDAGIAPELVLVLEVPDEVLIERVVGRRMDPETGKIYHLKFNPPPADVAKRCVQRSDDTEDKAKARLEVFYKNQDCLNAYVGKIVRIDGNRTKEVVFADIKRAIDSAFN